MTTRARDPQQPLGGKRAIVTGVASGLGTVIASELSSAGALVVGCDVNDDDGCAAMAGVGDYLHADVRREADVEKLVADVVTRIDGLDIFVNNAAIQIEREIIDTTEDEFDAIISVNLKGVFFGTKHAVRAMIQGGGGAIINIASVLGLVGDGLLPAYCAAKGGVLGLTRATAVQYASSGIRCNAVCPGDIETPLFERYLASLDHPDSARQAIAAEYPTGRIATPQDIARVVTFLASDDSSFIVGQPIVVDGGLLASCY